MQLSLPFEADPKLSRIRARLIALHGLQCDQFRCDPTTQFVRAMLSSCTRDEDSEGAFRRLSIVLPSLALLPGAHFSTIAAAIQLVTRPAQKAIDLVNAARSIRAQYGAFDLAFLADWPVDAAMSWLRHLRGVGSKVAAATLNFSTLRKRAFVVDRHVLRLCSRLGLLPPKADFERGFRILMRLMPIEWDADDLYELHWLMKTHGQITCRHERPACGDCPLALSCANAAALRSGGPVNTQVLLPNDNFVAGGLGFEPRFSESESDVLPLNYPPKLSQIQ
jgi:endonuclease III